jgi:hypothetical protein
MSQRLSTHRHRPGCLRCAPSPVKGGGICCHINYSRLQRIPRIAGLARDFELDDVAGHYIHAHSDLRASRRLVELSLNTTAMAENRRRRG